MAIPRTDHPGQQGTSTNTQGMGLHCSGAWATLSPSNFTFRQLANAPWRAAVGHVIVVTIQPAHPIRMTTHLGFTNDDGTDAFAGFRAWTR